VPMKPINQTFSFDGGMIPMVRSKFSAGPARNLDCDGRPQPRSLPPTTVIACIRADRNYTSLLTAAEWIVVYRAIL
jgi:hypothetical protein